MRTLLLVISLAAASLPSYSHAQGSADGLAGDLADGLADGLADDLADDLADGVADGVANVHAVYEGRCAGRITQMTVGGSAFSVSNLGLWLTAAHVVAPQLSVPCQRRNVAFRLKSLTLLTGSSASSCSARIAASVNGASGQQLAYDHARKVTLLETEQACIDAQRPALRLASETQQRRLRRNQTLTSIGYPAASQAVRWAPGHVDKSQWQQQFAQALVTHDFGSHQWPTTARPYASVLTTQATIGDLGAPLILGRTVVGMILTASAGRAFSVQATELRDFLNEHTGHLSARDSSGQPVRLEVRAASETDGQVTVDPYAAWVPAGQAHFLLPGAYAVREVGARTTYLVRIGARGTRYIRKYSDGSLVVVPPQIR